MSKLIYIVVGLLSIFVLCLMFVLSNSPAENAATIETPKAAPNPIPTLKVNYRYDLFPNERYLPEDIFSQLPPIPLDFQAVRTKFYSGQLSTSRVTEKYWKQPEFYEDWETSGISSFINGKPEGYSLIGYGAFPSEYIALIPRNDEFELTFYAKSAFGVVFYQGVSIEPNYLSTVSMRKNFFADLSRSVNQSPEYVKKHIKIISITPNKFLLEPTYNYQVYEFGANDEIVNSKAIMPRIENNWVREIKIKFKVEDLDAGRYAIVFDFKPPSSEFSYKNSDKLLTRYYAVGTEMNAGWSFAVFFDVL
jgi:hypothetical protein